MNEFELIRTFFAGHGGDALLGVGDDAALVQAPHDGQLAVSVDTLVAGVHFPPDLPAHALGHRALAVNLSDLAAMGARPRWCTLALTLPTIEPDWVAGFAAGFTELAAQHQVALIGGDTTRGPLSITVQVLGECSRPLLRSAGRPGDGIFLGGPVGFGGGGLACWAQRAQGDADRAALVDGFLYPQPQVALGLSLADRAAAAIDVSDGVLADLGHLCDASGCGADVEVEQVPMPEALVRCFGRDRALELALAGGDDYVLLFCLAHGDAAPGGTRIGSLSEQHGIRLTDHGQAVSMPATGYEHFRG